MSRALECVGVSVCMADKVLLASTTASFQPGRFAAILGPNGAGKSTLLSVLAGQRVPTQGEARLDGRPLADHALVALARRRALMPQESAVAFDFTAGEIVALGRYPHRGFQSIPAQDDDAIVAAAMTLTDVSALADRVLNSLSGGEKARVHLARALAQLWASLPDGAVRWLLLDEPTAALDLAHQHAAMRLLRDRSREGMGVIAVLHDLNLARRYADEVLILDGQGGMHRGAASELLQPPLIEQIWRMPCQQVESADGTPQFLFG
ncbi:heme ABC transporter ATP-binding protein [Variovorax sp. RHLX14]|uniref:heme ABC transporter ATP-binding protein n=1 Tax=Variovorax sp. RHLX14 TaxID=1259731 RepID=UPI003F478580